MQDANDLFSMRSFNFLYLQVFKRLVASYHTPVEQYVILMPVHSQTRISFVFSTYVVSVFSYIVWLEMIKIVLVQQMSPLACIRMRTLVE